MARPEPNVFSQKCGNGVVGAAASIVTSTATGTALCATASGTSVIVARKAISARSLLMSVTPVTGARVAARRSFGADVQQNELVRPARRLENPGVTPLPAEFVQNLDSRYFTFGPNFAKS